MNGISNVLIKSDSERRLYPREDVEARVRVCHDRLGVLDGYSKNISDTGIFVHLTDLPKLALGSFFGLQMMDSVSPGILFHTELVRVAHFGVALHIVNYELNGKHYSLEELRRQWRMSKNDVDYNLSR